MRHNYVIPSMPHYGSTSTHNSGINTGQRLSGADTMAQSSYESFSDNGWPRDAYGKSGIYKSLSYLSDAEQPLLRHPSPPFRTTSLHDLSSPDSYSSGDMLEALYSPRRRQERRDREHERLGWEDGYDIWSLCLGVYLIGFVVVIALGAAVVAIWILLHQ